MSWYDDPRLLEADCDAEDLFVYSLVQRLTPYEPDRRRLHGLAQVILDRAGERGCLPPELAFRVLTDSIRSVGLSGHLAARVRGVWRPTPVRFPAALRGACKSHAGLAA